VPLFMSVLTIRGGPSVNDLTAAHVFPGAERSTLGVTCVRSWISEPAGKVFCLVEADEAELAGAAHARSGLVADECLRVREIL
jgi:hypothetical protein